MKVLFYHFTPEEVKALYIHFLHEHVDRNENNYAGLWDVVNHISKIVESSNELPNRDSEST
jgi:hypothetical protein